MDFYLPCNSKLLTSNKSMGKDGKNENILDIWKNVDKCFLPLIRVTGLSIFQISYKAFKSDLVGVFYF